jgi:murein L,D-transpeptidase YcbB/YkuD
MSHFVSRYSVAILIAAALIPAKAALSQPVTQSSLWEMNQGLWLDSESTDRAVAERIQALLTGDESQSARQAGEREALRAFYESRSFAPAWSRNGKPTKNATAAARYLANVADDGLDPADYPAPAFDDADVSKLASDDVRMSTSLLAFVRHASVGRISFAKVSDAISYDLKAPEPLEVLPKLAAASDIGAELNSFLPQHAGYKALRAKLAELRKKGQAVRIPDGPVLSLGKEDPRVPLLRKALNVPKGEGLRFGKPLEAAVREFQKNANLAVTGTVGSATLSRINGGNSKLEDLIIANMERWRWLPHDLGSTHVVVNVPDYSLKVFDGERLVWSTKIIVGKPGHMATPLLSATMQHLTINPTWNVPPSIIRNEYLPKLSADPDALDRLGLKVKRKANGSIQVYQPPGSRNALGRIRFNFPNEFSVYQHDTPNKDLFARNERALSHGCMRVKDPEKYAEVLLSLSQPQDHFSADRIRKLYGDEERNIKLKAPIQVHITYQTAFVDEAGQLQTRADIYGRDQTMLSLLGGQASKLAEMRSKTRL